jgi:phenylalanyl-tRNA synthetase beta chain
MKLPLSWLREWVAIEAPAKEIAEALTLRGFYVEGIETHGRSYPGVVVARVLEANKHPNADKLSLCRVDAGAGELSIVCGAPNVRAGMFAALATIGATLPGGMTIKRAKIRGEESQGMLCSPRELEMSDEHLGILDLEVTLAGRGALEIGRPLDAYLDPPDPVLEIEIPFNRPDGLGIVGLAREVKAAFGAAWTPAARAILDARWTPPSGGAAFDLAIDDAEGCPRYIAQAVEGVKVGPSPHWLVRRLEAMGQRSIDNLVDLTNLILLELGQPVHAFDLDTLKGPAIRVRRGRAGETLTTLDGRERTLSPDLVVIADRDRAVALGGIMGGAATEVTAGTTRLLLECAGFDPGRVRRGARTLGLATEASKRYERGVDPAIGRIAVARFLALLAELSPGARPGVAAEVTNGADAPRMLTLRPSRWTRLLGMEVTPQQASDHLEALEFGVRANGDLSEPGGPLGVTVPSWRPDVTLEDDLVEEVGRAHGYARIPEAAPDSRGAFAVRTPRERTIARARRAMIARGFTEAWSSSLVADREARSAGALLTTDPESLVRLVNPMSREGEVLRPSPLPGLLRALAHNLRQGASSVRMFEVGAGFTRTTGKGTLAHEPLMLAAVVTGARYAHAHDAAQQNVDWDDARGLWDAWLTEMGVDTPRWRSYSADGWKPGASAEVASATSRIAWAGTLGQQALQTWEIEAPAMAPVHAFVALLDGISPELRAGARARVPGRFPPMRRDLAWFVPRSVTHDQLATSMRDAAGEWLVSLELFDVYEGPGTPDGMKSLAFALQFQHPERTLGEAEVQAIQDRMTAALATSCGARLRER